MTQVEVWQKLACLARYDARELAIHCDISLRTLQRQFQEALKRSPQHWLKEQRLLAAKDLLIQGIPIKAIASDLGFKHYSHFCRQFKELSKMTPSEFAAAQLNGKRPPDNPNDYSI